MRRALWSLVGGVVVAITVGAGVALATSVTPSGGAPGSSYVVKVPCTSEPQVYVVDLNDNPPATLDPGLGPSRHRARGPSTSSRATTTSWSPHAAVV